MSETIGKALEEFKEDIRRAYQRLASLEQDARQPRVAMEVDVTPYKKTRERTEGDASAVQAKHRYSCSAKRVQACPTSSTSFGKKAERDDVLVDNGAAAPKSYLSSLEIRTPIAADGLLPAGKASTTTRITYNQPRLRFCPIEETSSKRTSIQYASCYSSFWRNNQLAASFCRTVIETKSGQLWCSIPAVLQVIYAPVRF